VLENGTQSLAAFLAYSRGLAAEDAGDFSRAAAYFSEAVQTDPGFQAAKDQYQAASVTSQVQEASSAQITTVVNTPSPTGPTYDALLGQLNDGVKDNAGTQSEQNAPGGSQTGQQSTDAPSATSGSTAQILGTPKTATGTIRIIFRLP
jgi:hypothetical protein